VRHTYRLWLIARTYFVVFCCLVQLDMLFDLPCAFNFPELDLPLPCSEEEWNADQASKWSSMHTASTRPPTPTFRETFKQLLGEVTELRQQYSEFGGYVMISGILLAILSAQRLVKIPPMIVNISEFEKALDNWQRMWQIDPKSRCTGPGSQSGAMAFNAAAICRAANVRRFRDYSRFCSVSRVSLMSRAKNALRFLDEKACTDEILRMFQDHYFERTPDMIRALVPACVSFQIPVKLGVKLVAHTAALFWSVEHVFCNFELGMFPFTSLNLALFLLEWLLSVERDAGDGLNEDEHKIINLLNDLVLEADFHEDEQLLSIRFLTVKAYQFDGVNVWGSKFV